MARLRLPLLLRRNRHDREIVRLAVPALGALAAEPLYLLADTVIVGRIGTTALGGLAVAGSVLAATFGLCNFLAFGTTGAVARRFGAGDRRGAAEQGLDGLWLGLALGALLAAAGLLLAPAVVTAMGASAAVRGPALTYLRISLLGAPAVLVALAGVGYLRGLQDTRTTLLVAVGSNVLNLALELVFVFGLDLGIAGSAWATVLAQYTAAAVYVVVAVRQLRSAGASAAPRPREVLRLAAVGSRLVLRTGALLLAFLLSTAVAARISDDALAAYQIAFQVWWALAFCLDAIAIAAQAMVGRFLGGHDAAEARAASLRMLELGVVVGIVAGALLALAAPLLAAAFTDDPGVRALARESLYFVAAMQPLNAAVFVLDGVLIGAGDAGYLAFAMAGATALYVPVALLVLATTSGLPWLWGALFLFMGARLVGMGARFAGPRWAVVGAVRR